MMFHNFALIFAHLGHFVHYLNPSAKLINALNMDAKMDSPLCERCGDAPGTEVLYKDDGKSASREPICVCDSCESLYTNPMGVCTKCDDFAEVQVFFTPRDDGGMSLVIACDACARHYPKADSYKDKRDLRRTPS
jgi:hypothetical protein